MVFPDEDAWDLLDTDATSLSETRPDATRSSDDSTRPAPAARSGPSPFDYARDANAEADLIAVTELSDEPPASEARLVNAVTVRFGAARNVGQFDAGQLAIARGDQVVVEGTRGLTVGRAVGDSARSLVKQRLPRVLRAVKTEEGGNLSPNDVEREAARFCKNRIDERGLEMKLVRAELLHNRSKAVFYFTADGRVDFRELVRDLSRELHMRIEMRQVGVRDESKITGGLGPCGRELCCSSWISDFAPVSIRMAKDQNLALNPTKVSGMCGRLKCCLAYEQGLYREARKKLPKVGQQVSTPKGNGRVHELDIPRGLVRVLVADNTITTFPASELAPISTKDSGKHRS